ncbi:MAG TPA: protein phosphatase 2C domain-containing protein [Leptospiraceae bacterium]|nr:protein phosphatase 2C domain-containing protein [Leptospiraceae bacterium]
MIALDSYYAKGTSHIVCQDYAVHKGNFAMGSDGCSSSPDTDVGARALVNNALGLFKTEEDKIITDAPLLVRTATRNASTTLHSMYLSSASIDATLFGISVLKDRVYAFIAGDGFLYKKYKNGNEELMSVEFENNMPFYQGYITNEERYLQYKSHSLRATVSVDFLRDDLKENNYAYSTSAVNFLLTDLNYIEDLELLLLFSDGLATWQAANKENLNDKKDIPTKEILDKIKSVKSHSPGFLQRKILNGLKKEYKGWELSHWDDFSVVGLANYDT